MTAPRYQVFVSSTFTDLVEERRQVSEQLQKLRCIPAGMELFSASGRPPWALIESAIDDSDYVVLILAGRYGSTVDDDDLSYTEREYDYALSLEIPVLAFLHNDVESLASRSVDTGALAEKRDRFWDKVKDSGRHTVDFWTDASDLAQKVLVAIATAISTEPRPGWVRATVESDPEGDRGSAVARRSVALSRADDVRDALVAPGGGALVERAISDATRSVTDLPFVKGDAAFDVRDVEGEYTSRVAELEMAAGPLVTTVAAAARWGDGTKLDDYWLDLIRELSASPRLGGSTVLIDLVRAPAVLVFTAAGLGACAGRRDDLVGLLLSERLAVENPYNEEDVPAVAMLGGTLMYPNAWASKRLRSFLASTLAADEAWQGSTFDRAWERWEYLASVARTYYATKLRTPSGGQPYLRIEDRIHTEPRPVAAKVIRRGVADSGDSHALLSMGLTEGRAELFDEAAEIFDARYGKWGDQQDMAALPPIGGGGYGGFLPSGPHYPGEGARDLRG